MWPLLYAVGMAAPAFHVSPRRTGTEDPYCEARLRTPHRFRERSLPWQYAGVSGNFHIGGHTGVEKVCFGVAYRRPLGSIEAMRVIESIAVAAKKWDCARTWR